METADPFPGVIGRWPKLLPVKRRRLVDGAKAMVLPEPKSTAEIREQIEIIADGIRALQSLDDLGKETNKQIMDDMAVLQKKYDRLNRQLKGRDKNVRAK